MNFFIRKIFTFTYPIFGDSRRFLRVFPGRRIFTSLCFYLIWFSGKKIKKRMKRDGGENEQHDTEENPWNKKGEPTIFGAEKKVENRRRGSVFAQQSSFADCSPCFRGRLWISDGNVKPSIAACCAQMNEIKRGGDNWSFESAEIRADLFPTVSAGRHFLRGLPPPSHSGSFIVAFLLYQPSSEIRNIKSHRKKLQVFAWESMKIQCKKFRSITMLKNV